MDNFLHNHGERGNKIIIIDKNKLKTQKAALSKLCYQFGQFRKEYQNQRTKHR